MSNKYTLEAVGDKLLVVQLHQSGPWISGLTIHVPASAARYEAFYTGRWGSPIETNQNQSRLHPRPLHSVLQQSTSSSVELVKQSVLA